MTTPTEYHCAGCGAPWSREHVEVCPETRRLRLAVVVTVQPLCGGGCSADALDDEEP